MIIDFPQFVEYKYFYRFLLGKLITFANSEAENMLILNLQQTDYLAPNVICDLLCYFKYLRSLRTTANVYLSFGSSVRLSSYLDNAWFFLQSENGSLFSTDLLSFGSNDPHSKLVNTSKINRIAIPNVGMQGTSVHLPLETVNQVHRQVNTLFSKTKIAGMHRYGISGPAQITTAFTEILENSYCHSQDYRNCGCYYTFQNYKKTGLNFACSDIGVGFYDSLIQQFSSPNCVKQPKIFSKTQFQQFASDDKRKHLAAILESIVYRVGEGANIDYGFPYIISTLVIPNDGELIIHCVNTLLKIDISFLRTYFVINEGRIIDFNTQALRDLVLSESTFETAIETGILRIYDYFFPGVHFSVRIKGE